jgi:hypothetical protein
MNFAVLGLAACHTKINLGTGMCVHIPFRLDPKASLAWLGKHLLCPLFKKKKEKEKRKKIHLLKRYTHTHARAHTCSEISYRITDLECILRAKTLQLILTGAVG